jgi:hypothetical protein
MRAPNKRPGVDAGWRVLYAFQCPRSRATQAERSAGMRLALSLLIISVSAGCATKSEPPTVAVAPPPAILTHKVEASDPIDRVIARFNGLSMNGLVSGLELPSTASPEEVVKNALEKAEQRIGRVTSCQIMEIRYFRFGSASNSIFTAALVQTNVGKKIVLFANEHPKFWWHRVYDA